MTQQYRAEEKRKEKKELRNMMLSRAAITRMQAMIIAGIIIAAAIIGAVAYYASIPAGPVVTEKTILRREMIVPGGRIDPATAWSYPDTQLCCNLYDSLVHPKVGMAGGVDPQLATSWTVSPDGLKFTFYLKQGVKFHDGTEVKAEDVVFSMDRIITIKQGMSFLFVPYISSSKAVDDYTVEFTLKKLDGPFLSAIPRLWILNKDLVKAHIKTPGSYGDNGDYGTDWLLINDAGSGPYMIDHVKLQEGYWLNKNGNYTIYAFDPKAPDQIYYGLPYEPVAIKAAMNVREFEATDIWQSQDSLAALDAINGVELKSYFWGNALYLYMHNKKPPTDDIHIRKAIAYAIDYSKLRSIYPGASPMTGPVPVDVPGWNPNCTQYTLNLEKATAELQQSKYYQYGNLSAYPIEFHWYQEVPDEEKIALSLMTDLAKINLTLLSVKTPSMKITEELSKAENAAHMYPMYIAVNYPEAGSMIEMRFHSSAQGTFYQGEWLGNETIDALIEDAQSTVDQTQRFQKLANIQQIIADMCVCIFAYNAPGRFAYQTYVSAPLIRGEPLIASIGYNYEFREWSVDWAKRKQLLTGGS
jgi:peptide/nickel transport system substrate-binding protein